jgi:hypothetical protein
MTLTVRGVFLLVAVICFLLAALNVPRGNWTAIGLGFFAGSFLV